MNDAYLIGSAVRGPVVVPVPWREDVRAGEGCVADASARVIGASHGYVPPAWMALFAAEDLVWKEVVDPETGVFRYPGYTVPAALATERFRRRTPALRRLLDRGKRPSIALAHVLEQLAAWLTQVAVPYLHLEAYDAWSLEGALLIEDFEGAFTALDGPPADRSAWDEGWVRFLCGYTRIEPGCPQGAAPVHLRGHLHDPLGS